MRNLALVILAVTLTAAPAAAQMGTTTVQAPIAGSAFTAGGVTLGSQPMRVMIAPVGDDQIVPTLIQDDALNLLFGSLQVDIGFEYLRPTRSFRDNGLVIPAVAAGAFPQAAQIGDLSHDFAFIPRFGIEYKFSDLGFGVAASGKLFNLRGDVRRSVSTASGSAVLNAEDNVNVGIANFLEGVLRFDLDPNRHHQDRWLHDPKAIGTFGARYSYVGQNLSTSLVSGENLINLTSTQDFNGFGITGSLGALCQVGDRGLGIYGFSRGSVLAGRNNRTSTYSVVVPGIPGASTADQITDLRTILIPVGEFEAGLSWMKPVPVRAAATNLAPLTWIRAGMAAQVWGGMGLLEAPTVRVFFADRPLVLYGFTVAAGLDY
jgi:hypothetical protein